GRHYLSSRCLRLNWKHRGKPLLCGSGKRKRKIVEIDGFTALNIKVSMNLSENFLSAFKKFRQIIILIQAN
ncbi:MAG: hypothetical protein KKD29_05095, partial [Candidatus Omnitrophica bacterium]|nr:hypothetical protein [Candidatus Omnitrophota bacterium]